MKPTTIQIPKDGKIRYSLDSSLSGALRTTVSKVMHQACRDWEKAVPLLRFEEAASAFEETEFWVSHGQTSFDGPTTEQLAEWSLNRRQISLNWNINWRTSVWDVFKPWKQILSPSTLGHEIGHALLGRDSHGEWYHSSNPKSIMSPSLVYGSKPGIVEALQVRWVMDNMGTPDQWDDLVERDRRSLPEIYRPPVFIF